MKGYLTQHKTESKQGLAALNMCLVLITQDLVHSSLIGQLNVTPYKILIVID
jgi:hypothetical protein